MYYYLLYILIFNVILYFIFFYTESSNEPYIIEGDYIFQRDPLNKGEYSRFNHKTKECVNWVSKTICNEILLCKKLKPKILVLGVALGDMIIHLSNKRKDFIITGVDISDINFKIVKLYTNATLIKEDANIFIRNTENTYDYIICDIFDSITIPDFIFSDEFINKINNILLPNGKFMINTVNIEKSKIDQSFRNIRYDMKTNYINTIYIINK